MCDGENVSLGFEFVFSDVNGNDKVRFFGLDELFEESVVFLMEKVEPCLWGSWR